MNYVLDLKHALRIWVKSWGHSTLSIVVVALSLGLALWAYALVYSQALQSLGFPDSDSWYSMQISRTATASPRPAVDSYTYQRIVDETSSLDHLGAVSARSALLSEGEASVSLRAADISPRLLSATGEKPLFGRLFEDTDGQIDAAPVVILSFDGWQNYFAGDPDIVGRLTTIDSRLFRIIGVMPEDFFAFQDFEVWMPLHIERLVRADASDRVLSPFIALRSGQNPDKVAAEIQPVVDEINLNYPDLFDPDRNVELIPGRLMSTHQILHVVTMIALLALAILLLGCVNISLIFLARLLERSRELALRSAIGASRGRLMGQCLAETAIVILVGLVLGYGLAMLGVEWAQGMSEFTSQVRASGRSSNIIELRAVDIIAAIVIAIFIWLLSTLIPAWRIAKQDAATVLAGTGKGSAVKGNSKSTNLLVGLQVLVSSVVLVVCVNLVLAIHQEANKPLGIDVEQVVVTTKPSIFDGEYDEINRRISYWRDLEKSINSSIPGSTVAHSTTVPIQPRRVAVDLETDGDSGNRGRLQLPMTAVSERYFDLLGIQLLHGRLFDSTDNGDAINVAVVDEKTADRYWPGESAIGKRIQVHPSEGGPWLTVVGVVSGVSGTPYSPDIGVVYRPLHQELPEAFHTLVKLPPNSSASRATLRAAAYQVDRNLPMNNIQTLDDYLAVVYLGFNSIIPVLVAITIITVILAATGLFGLISRSVAQRTQEVGIRRALGATKPQSISMFFRQGGIYLIVSLVGMAMGIIFTNLSSAVFTNALDSIFLVIFGVLILFLFVIFLSAYLPASRALTLEPGDALRYE